MDYTPFVDPVAVYLDALASFGPVVQTRPAQMSLPLIHVHRVGGDSALVDDRPRIDVDVYAATYPAAMTLARQIQQRLISGPVQTVAGIVDRTFTEVGPREVSYTDEMIRLVAATYRSTLRRL